MELKHRAGLVAALALLSGCASIVDGKNQVVSVETRSKSAPVIGSQCKLTNDKGSWYVTTPGTTTVQRSYQDLNIQCSRKGMAPSMAAIKSSTKGMAFGNIIFGGVIGAGVDIASGAAYDYPSPITVEMNDLIEPERLSRPAAVQGSETKPPEDAEARKANVMLADAGCQTTQLPTRFKEGEGATFYEAFCADGRLMHSVCTSSGCRLRTAKD